MTNHPNALSAEALKIPPRYISSSSQPSRAVRYRPLLSAFNVNCSLSHKTDSKISASSSSTSPRVSPSSKSPRYLSPQAIFNFGTPDSKITFSGSLTASRMPCSGVTAYGGMPEYQSRNHSSAEGPITASL